MEKTRESYIRDIRARLPYMTDRDLRMTDSFIFGLCAKTGYGYSIAEHDRPVLSTDEQHDADRATTCMRTIAYALTGTRGFIASCILEDDIDAPADALVLGRHQGDLIEIEVRPMMKIWNEAGWKRIKASLLVDHLERYGYILPRHKKPKTIMVNGERREVVYVFKDKLQPFIDDAARDLD